MKKFFWCLFRSTTYNVDTQLNELIYKCIWLLDNCQNIAVSIGYYHITIKTSSTIIELWNANKFYGWLSIGSINGRGYRNVSASAEAMYDFKECLKKHGHNIYVPEPRQTLDLNIDNIAC